MNIEKIMEVLDKIFSNSIVKSVLVVIVSVAVYKIISVGLSARGRRLKKLDRKKGETYIHLINSIVKYAVLIIAFFVILQVNHVNITSMIAGLGIAGVILGVAVQDALKDIIRGFDIVSDNYFNVGDLIEYQGIEGKVLEIGIKTTKIKDIKTENIVSIPNRSIDAAALVSDCVYVEVPMPYEIPLKEAQSVVEEICREQAKSERIKECNYLGVNKLDDSAVKYLIKATCADNSQKLQVRRDCCRTILDVMEKHSISVPYNQIDVHTK